MEYHSGGSLPLLGRPRYCPGANANGGYLCETGHCCGETGCCTYYYELWWFWLLWTILILFSCCCAYRHRRAKLRVQQQQRQREISLLAYHGANSFTSSMLDLSFLASLKLPSYEEVAAQPSTPPPPYSSVFTTPRYPQPPRAADPHLLTQHGPLLHRPLSDGPSSLSSDNSSSCSCDSCCPSSPCSSSLSAPITYETDTSHASTPSEATPLTLDVTMETISAAADCLRANGARLSLERTSDDIDASRARKPPITDTTVSSQTVTTAVVTRAASPQPPPELNLPLGVTTVVKQQLDIASCSSSTLHSPGVVNMALPSIQVMGTEGPVSGSKGPHTPTASTTDCPTSAQTPETLNSMRTCDTTSAHSSPASVPSPDVGRTLDSAVLVISNSSLMPIQRSPDVEPTESQTTRNDAQLEPADHVLLIPSTESKTGSGVTDSTINLSSVPTPANLMVINDTGPTSPKTAKCRNPGLQPGLGLLEVPTSPGSRLPQDSGSLTVPISSIDYLQSKDSLPSEVCTGFGSGLGPLSSPTPPDTIPITGLSVLANSDTNFVPIPVPGHTQTVAITTGTQDQEPQLLPRNLAPDQVLLDVVLVPNAEPQITTGVSDSAINSSPVTKPANLTLISDAARTSPTLAAFKNLELSPESGLLEVHITPRSELSHCSASASFVDHSGSSQPKESLSLDTGFGLGLRPVLTPVHTIPTTLISDPNFVPVLGRSINIQTPVLESSQNPTTTTQDQESLPLEVRAGFNSGCDGSGLSPLVIPTLVPTLPTSLAPSSSSCPAITIETESSFAPYQSPPSSPSSIPSPTSPPSLEGQSTTSLLLDPLTALHQSDRGGSFSGHASSLSPSPRATQSPPKQTLFSPCVDVFEPVPPSLEDEEEDDQEEKDEEDDEDMGADESQYRHRRLTGDSGIEVCRCRVEEEDDNEEEEESRRGGGDIELHDSVDCPARGQLTPRDGLTLCTPTAATTPTSEDSGEVVIVMETV